MTARITIVALLSLLAVLPPEMAGADRPNVLLILTDDQGYGDIAAHGNPVIRTPNIDRLAVESVRFTDFHVAPMCSPTRGQLMTGRDAMKNGATAVCQGRSMMRADIPTMADFFAASGYATGHFGKWHLGDSYPHRPQDRGFQETLHHRAWGITSLADYWGNTYFDPVLEHNGVDTAVRRLLHRHLLQPRRCSGSTSSTQQGKPFFVYLATNTPARAERVSPNDTRAPYRRQVPGQDDPRDVLRHDRQHR